MNTGLAFMAAAAVIGAYKAMDKWRPTNTGLSNAWTIEGLGNVLRLSGNFQKALDIAGGRMTSCFRSPAVNRAVGGVPTSLHQSGRGMDIGGLGDRWSSALDELKAAIRRGELGEVHEILYHKRHIHIGWKQ